MPGQHLLVGTYPAAIHQFLGGIPLGPTVNTDSAAVHVRLSAGHGEADLNTSGLRSCAVAASDEEQCDESADCATSNTVIGAMDIDNEPLETGHGQTAARGLMVWLLHDAN